TMHAQQSVPLITASIVALAWGTVTPAQEPGYPKLLATGPINYASSSPPNGFLGLALASESEGQHKRPVVCFGFRQVGDDNKYTYFIIFKTDRTKKWALATGTGGDGTVGFNGREATLDKLQLRFGTGESAKKVAISYHAA